MPFPTPGDLPNPGIKLTSPAPAGGFFTTEPVLEVTAKETMIADERKIGSGYYGIHRGSQVLE